MHVSSLLADRSQSVPNLWGLSPRDFGQVCPLAATCHHWISCLMCRAAEAPGGTVLELKMEASTDAMYRPRPTSRGAASRVPSWPSWVWQQLGRMALLVTSWAAVKWLLRSLGSFRRAACSKEVWSLQELGLAAEIACGRTGRVYEGCIHGQHVAVKVCLSLLATWG